MSEFDAELANIFRDESVRRLDEMDAALLAIESGEPGAEAIDSLFRNAHTIKGAAGMVGFDDVRTLAHAVEDVLGSVRESGVFPPELAAPLLRATAVLRAQVTGAGEVADDDLLDDLAAALAPLSDRTAGPPGAGPADPADAGAAARTSAGPPPAARTSAG
ncbi:MAG TPA: Hpt domain-containing protein, partial [Streptosporangiaceae bacterium]|nr:Hpt domain-containing protein [Streptosporangiaceae bacterium]